MMRAIDDRHIQDDEAALSGTFEGANSASFDGPSINSECFSTSHSVHVDERTSSLSPKKSPRSDNVDHFQMEDLDVGGAQHVDPLTSSVAVGGQLQSTGVSMPNGGHSGMFSSPETSIHPGFWTPAQVSLHHQFQQLATAHRLQNLYRPPNNGQAGSFAFSFPNNAGALISQTKASSPNCNSATTTPCSQQQQQQQHLHLQMSMRQHQQQQQKQGLYPHAPQMQQASLINGIPLPLMHQRLPQPSTSLQATQLREESPQQGVSGSQFLLLSRPHPLRGNSTIQDLGGLIAQSLPPGPVTFAIPRQQTGNAQFSGGMVRASNSGMAQAGAVLVPIPVPVSMLNGTYRTLLTPSQLATLPRGPPAGGVTAAPMGVPNSSHPAPPLFSANLCHTPSSSNGQQSMFTVEDELPALTTTMISQALSGTHLKGLKDIPDHSICVSSCIDDICSEMILDNSKPPGAQQNIDVPTVTHEESNKYDHDELSFAVRAALAGRRPSINAQGRTECGTPDTENSSVMDVLRACTDRARSLPPALRLGEHETSQMMAFPAAPLKSGTSLDGGMGSNQSTIGLSLAGILGVTPAKGRKGPPKGARKDAIGDAISQKSSKPSGKGSGKGAGETKLEVSEKKKRSVGSKAKSSKEVKAESCAENGKAGISDGCTDVVEVKDDKIEGNLTLVNKGALANKEFKPVKDPKPKKGRKATKSEPSKDATGAAPPKLKKQCGPKRKKSVTVPEEPAVANSPDDRPPATTTKAKKKKAQATPVTLECNVPATSAAMTAGSNIVDPPTTVPLNAELSTTGAFTTGSSTADPSPCISSTIFPSSMKSTEENETKMIEQLEQPDGVPKKRKQSQFKKKDESPQDAGKLKPSMAGDVVVAPKRKRPRRTKPASNQIVEPTALPFLPAQDRGDKDAIICTCGALAKAQQVSSQSQESGPSPLSAKQLPEHVPGMTGIPAPPFCGGARKTSGPKKFKAASTQVGPDLALSSEENLEGMEDIEKLLLEVGSFIEGLDRSLAVTKKCKSSAKRSSSLPCPASGSPHKKRQRVQRKKLSSETLKASLSVADGSAVKADPQTDEGSKKPRARAKKSKLALPHLSKALPDSRTHPAPSTPADAEMALALALGRGLGLLLEESGHADQEPSQKLSLPHMADDDTDTGSASKANWVVSRTKEVTDIAPASEPSLPPLPSADKDGPDAIVTIENMVEDNPKHLRQPNDTREPGVVR